MSGAHLLPISVPTILAVKSPKIFLAYSQRRMNIGKLYCGLKLGKILVHRVNNRSLWIGVAGYPYKKYDGHKCIHVMELGSVNAERRMVFNIN